MNKQTDNDFILSFAKSAKFPSPSLFEKNQCIITSTENLK